MKNRKALLIIAVALAVLMLGTVAVSAILRSDSLVENDPRVAYTEEMLSALSSGDADGAYLLIEDAVDRELFDEWYSKVSPHFAAAEGYEFSFVSASRGREYRGAWRTYSRAEFSVELHGVGRFKLVTTLYEGIDGVGRIAFDRVSVASYSPLSVIFTVLSLIACLGFVGFAFYDCFKNCKEKKPLWLVLMLVGLIDLKLTVFGTDLSFDLGFVTAFRPTASFDTGEICIHLILPLAAVVWLFVRRMLSTEQRGEDSTLTVDAADGAPRAKPLEQNEGEGGEG